LKRILRISKFREIYLYARIQFAAFEYENRPCYKLKTRHFTCYTIWTFTLGNKQFWQSILDIFWTTDIEQHDKFVSLFCTEHWSYIIVGIYKRVFNNIIDVIYIFDFTKIFLFIIHTIFGTTKELLRNVRITVARMVTDGKHIVLQKSVETTRL